MQSQNFSGADTPGPRSSRGRPIPVRGVASAPVISLHPLDTYRVAQKVATTKLSKNRINEMRFIIRLKYESRAIILFVGIRYFMRDLLSDLNNHV